MTARRIARRSLPLIRRSLPSGSANPAPNSPKRMTPQRPSACESTGTWLFLRARAVTVQSISPSPFIAHQLTLALSAIFLSGPSLFKSE
ncbi:hypothetical protein J6590_029798 [Homalodisca vitripennis]|nr:hypothetical protein J6590_029798 [Homalodisca vitripennis]